MNDQHEYLTKEKFEELRGELDFLKNTKRKEIAQSLEYAKSLGDLSENAEYHDARENQSKTEERILNLENILKNAVIVSASSRGDSVSIGSEIEIKKEGDSTTRKFIMVGSEESDTANGKISYKSPLGSAMMGKKKDEKFTFQAPNGSEITYKIIDVK